MWFGLDLWGGMEVVVLVDFSAVWLIGQAFGEVVEKDVEQVVEQAFGEVVEKDIEQVVEQVVEQVD